MFNASKRLIPFRPVLDDVDVSVWALPEGATLRLGRGRVRDMAISPDGASLAVATKIGVWWYELETMQPVALWETERGMVSTVSFSHDGHWIATGNDDGVVKVWDVQAGVCIAEVARRTEATQLGVSHLAFSGDNQYLAVTGVRDPVVDIWDPESGTLCLRYYDEPHPSSNLCGVIRPVAFAPNNRLLACLNPAEFIAIWDITTDTHITTLIEQTAIVESLCFSPCGQYLAAGGRTGNVQVWNTATWKLQQSAPGDDALRITVSYSDEGVLHATGVSDDTALLWDVERDEKRWTYVEKEGGLQGAHFSRNSQFIVAGARDWSVWTDRHAQPRRFPHLHPAFPDSVVFAPDGKTLATGSWNEGVWDLATPSEQPVPFNLPGKNHRVSLSQAGKFLSTGIDGTTVTVWEIGETAPRFTFTAPTKETEVSAAAFSPIGHLIACGDSTGTLYLWDGQQQEKRWAIRAHEARIHSVVLSPDEKSVASIAREALDSRLWDVETGEVLTVFPDGIHTMAFSPCSRMIACGMGKQILLWDVRRGETRLTLPHTQQSWWPFALAFSPCGEYLASGAWWHRGMGIKKVAIRLWDVATGENIATFRGHPTDVQCLAFSPDGALLASGGYDDTLLLWEIGSYISKR